MAGLLDKISGAINHPMVQGIGLMAGLGFNPALGLLAGPAIKGDRERRELRNEQNRQSIADAKMRMDAQNQFAGLMNQRWQPPGADLNIMGIEGDVIGTAPGIPGIVPSEGLLANTVPAMQTPQGQSQMMGLLGQMAPAVTAQGLMAPQTGTTTRVPEKIAVVNAIQEALAAGDHQRAELLTKMAMSDPNADLTALQTDNARLENQYLLQRIGQGDKDAELAWGQKVRTARGAAADIIKLKKRTDALKESGVLGNPLPIETISGFAELAPGAIVEGLTDLITGEPMTKAQVKAQRDLQQEYDTFASGILVGNSQALEGFNSNAGRALLAQTKPSASLGYRPNLSSLARVADDWLLEDQLSPEPLFDEETRRELQAISDEAEAAFNSAAQSLGTDELRRAAGLD